MRCYENAWQPWRKAISCFAPLGLKKYESIEKKIQELNQIGAGEGQFTPKAVDATAALNQFLTQLEIDHSTKLLHLLGFWKTFQITHQQMGRGREQPIRINR